MVGETAGPVDERGDGRRSGRRQVGRSVLRLSRTEPAQRFHLRQHFPHLDSPASATAGVNERESVRTTAKGERFSHEAAHGGRANSVDSTRLSASRRSKVRGLWPCVCRLKWLNPSVHFCPCQAHHRYANPSEA